MSFSANQLRALRRDLSDRHVRTRQGNGRELCYIEGWHAIAEANRIFGYDGWDRETVESRCVMTREMRGTFLAVYTAKVRITVRAKRARVVREGHGSGEARGSSPGETHDLALKIAETDATKRALATFGNPFGLGLYLGGRAQPQKPDKAAHGGAGCGNTSQEAPQPPGNRVAALNQALNALDEQRSGHNGPAVTGRIDKSVLKFGEPRRQRDREHLKFVAAQACLLCGRQPSDPHHVRFAQPQALGRKVSDEFTVPLCRTHHRQVHHSGNELAWWQDMGIDPLEIAKTLWAETRKRPTSNSSNSEIGRGSSSTNGGERSGVEHDPNSDNRPDLSGSSDPQ
jgi:hypothetical protein